MDTATSNNKKTTSQIVITYIAVILMVFSMLSGTTTIADTTMLSVQLQTAFLPSSNKPSY